MAKNVPAATKKPRTVSNNPPVSAEDFVRAWQTCSSIDEVAETTGLARTSVTARAGNYRKKGVEIKNMGRGVKRIDIAALNKIAAEALEEVKD